MCERERGRERNRVRLKINVSVLDDYRAVLPAPPYNLRSAALTRQSTTANALWQRLDYNIWPVLLGISAITAPRPRLARSGGPFWKWRKRNEETDKNAWRRARQGENKGYSLSYPTTEKYTKISETCQQFGPKWNHFCSRDQWLANSLWKWHCLFQRGLQSSNASWSY